MFYVFFIIAMILLGACTEKTVQPHLNDSSSDGELGQLNQSATTQGSSSLDSLTPSNMSAISLISSAAKVSSSRVGSSSDTVGMSSGPQLSSITVLPSSEIGFSSSSSVELVSHEELSSSLTPNLSSYDVSSSSLVSSSQLSSSEQILSSSAEMYFDSTVALYHPDSLIIVEITLPKGDWNTLRYQTREQIVDWCPDGPFGNPFTYTNADVTINGALVKNVGLRKKGFIGSLNDEKPSLKIKFDKYVDGQEWAGVERLTLQNNNSDPSNVKQCLAYSIFKKMGVPSPRCNLAEVIVNGTSLGIYTNLEPIKKRFLRRHFESDEGNLYEITVADFTLNQVDIIEKKTNEKENDRSDLDAIVDALALPDNVLIDAIDPLIDLDAFYKFWIAELLVHHHDGYTEGENNAYIYFDPLTGKLHFVPWGTDDTFTDQTWKTQKDPVFARTKLSERLFGIEEMRERYFDEIHAALDTIWDVDEFNTQIDGLITVMGDKKNTAAISELRLWLESQKQNLLNGFNRTDLLTWKPEPWECIL